MRNQLLSSLAACAVLAISVGCGDDTDTPVSPTPEPSAATSTAAAELRFQQVTVQCGVATDRRAWCWGGNNVGQLGSGTTNSSENPVAVVGGHRFRSLSTGSSFTCGVTPGDIAFCWGHNQFGKLGNGTIEVDDCPAGIPCSTKPLRVAGGLRFIEVSAGQHHTCGVTTDNRVYCWGWNGFGQLGDGTTDDHLKPHPVSCTVRFTHVSTGNYHTCAVTVRHHLYCWGENSYGQLGTRGGGRDWQHAHLRPSPAAGGLEYRQVSAGYFDTCAITTDDRAYCWGDNSYGKLGNGHPNEGFQRTPSPVAGGLLFRQVDPGYLQTCGVTTANVAYCWGVVSASINPDGYTLTTIAVAGALRFRQVDEGGLDACAVTTHNRAYCWADDLTPQPLAAPE